MSKSTNCCCLEFEATVSEQARPRARLDLLPFFLHPKRNFKRNTPQDHDCVSEPIEAANKQESNFAVPKVKSSMLYDIDAKPSTLTMKTDGDELTDVRPSAVPQSAGAGPLEEFPLFSKMCSDLQVMIFKFMLPPAGVIGVHHIVKTPKKSKASFTLRLAHIDIKTFAKHRGVALMGVCVELNKMYKKAMPICLPMGTYRDPNSTERTNYDFDILVNHHKAPNFLRISTDDLVYFRSYLSTAASRIDRVQGLLIHQPWAKSVTQLGLYHAIFKKLSPEELNRALKGLCTAFPMLKEIRVHDSPVGYECQWLEADPRSPAPKLGDSTLSPSVQRRLFKKLEDLQAELDKDPYFPSNKKSVPRITYI
ncbi:hypothetical protein BKA64DRAFT_641750 [Cadophora sp. MPI-SDFR-AT-0126]|nr:hypothetical protein BKA64DRAFT_641750 [Leotiomycetes sp. MPI-SDFR-AT-0126]